MQGGRQPATTDVAQDLQDARSPEQGRVMACAVHGAKQRLHNISRGGGVWKGRDPRLEREVRFVDALLSTSPPRPLAPTTATA